MSDGRVERKDNHNCKLNAAKFIEATYGHARAMQMNSNNDIEYVSYIQIAVGIVNARIERNERFLCANIRRIVNFPKRFTNATGWMEQALERILKDDAATERDATT